jgi:hypothetical protein
MHDIPFYNLTLENLEKTRLDLSVYAIIYTLRQHVFDDSTRITIIAPFKWIILNYKFQIYIYTSGANLIGCSGSDNSKFAKLKSQLNGNLFSNLHILCLLINIDNLLKNFSNKPHERMTLKISSNK